MFQPGGQSSSTHSPATTPPIGYRRPSLEVVTGVHVNGKADDCGVNVALSGDQPSLVGRSGRTPMGGTPHVSGRAGDPHLEGLLSLTLLPVRRQFRRTPGRRIAHDDAR